MLKRLCSSVLIVTMLVLSLLAGMPGGVMKVMAADNGFVKGTPDTFYCFGWMGASSSWSNIIKTYDIGEEDLTRPNGYALTAAAAKTVLDRMPEGRRVIMVRYERKIAELNAENYIWWDKGAEYVANLTENLFKELKNIDAKVDAIICDYEGGLTNWHLSGNPQAFDVIPTDPRYLTDIKPRMEAYGFVSPTDKPELYYVKNWGELPDYKDMLIWNSVQRERFAEYMNTAIYNPAKKYFPNIKFSNYDYGKRNSSYPCPDLSGFREYLYGNGKQVGTHSSPVNYGWLWSINARPPEGADNFQKTPFSGLQHSVNLMRQAVLSDPNVKAQPWVANINFTGDQCLIGKTDYYHENIFHVGLFDPDPFLGWFAYTWPGDTEPGIRADQQQIQLFSDLLHELDEVAGFSDRRPLAAALTNWNSKYILSGMAAGGRNVWRITPDSSVVSVQDFKIRENTPQFQVGDTIIEFPEGSYIYTPTVEYAKGGYWVISPLNTYPTITGETVSTPKSGFDKIEAENYDGQSGVSVGTSGQVSFLSEAGDGDYALYRNVDIGSGDRGAVGFEANVASATGGKLEIRLDSRTGMLIGECAVPNTGGADTWQTASTSIFTNRINGKHTIYLMFKGNNGEQFNIDSFKFIEGAMPIPPVWSSASLKAENVAETSLKLTWTPATDNVGVTGYKVYSGKTLIGAVGSEANSYEVTGLQAGQTYTFKVEATDVEGNSTIDGPTAVVTTLDTTAPQWNGASLQTQNVTETSLDLIWTPAVDNVGIAGYKVYNGDRLVQTLTADISQASITGLNAGVDYTFKVLAFDGAGNTTIEPLTVNVTMAGTRDIILPQWNEASLKAQGIEPKAINLVWTPAADNVGVTEYKIYMGTTLIQAVDGSTTSCKITGLTQDTPYTFKVEAVDGIGNCTTDGPQLETRTARLVAAADILLQAEGFTDGADGSGNMASWSGIIAPGSSSDNGWVYFKDIDFKYEFTKMIFKVARGDSRTARIDVRLDSKTGPVIGSVNVESTGSWDIYNEQIMNLAGASGKHDVYMIFTGWGVGSFDWFKFSGGSAIYNEGSGDDGSLVPAADIFYEAENYEDSIPGIAAWGGIVSGGGSSSNDWIAFNAVDLKRGYKTLVTKVSVDPGNAGKNMEVRLDSLDGPLVGTLTVSSTGSWDTYTEQSTTLSGAAGVHKVYFLFKGWGVGNFDWFKFTDGKTENIIVPTGVSLNKTSLLLAEGKTGILAANVTPDDAVNKNVTWSTSDGTIAAVNNGIVTGLKDGTATITATTEVGRYTASCIVTVKAKPAATPKPEEKEGDVIAAYQYGVDGYTGTEDAGIAEYSFFPNNNFGANANFEVGRYASTDETDDKSAVLKFDVSNIPQNAVIVDAKVELTIPAVRRGYGQYADQKNIEVYDVLKSWNEGNKGGANGAAAEAGEVTWNFYQYPNRWDMPGGDAGLFPADTQTVTLGPIHDTTKAWDITSLVSNWVKNPTENFGLLLKENSDAAVKAGTIQFASKENEDVSSRPKLIVRYRIEDPGVVPVDDILLQAEGYNSGDGIWKAGSYIGAGSFSGDSWIAYDNIDFADGFTGLTARLGVPADQANKKVEFRLDGPQGALIGTLTTTSTGSWDTYGEQSIALTGASGVHKLYVMFKGWGTGSFDWFKLTAGSRIVKKNTAPELGSIGNKSVDEGQSLNFTINATDAENDALSFNAENLPAGASFDTATGTFTWKPDFEAAGSYSVSFTVSDGSLSDSETIDIVVNNVNREPEFDSIGSRSIKEGKSLNFTVNAVDPDNDTLTYSAANVPEGASFDAVTRTFTWTPGYTQSGEYKVTFNVSDGSLTDSVEEVIKVENVTAKELTLELKGYVQGLSINKAAKHLLTTDLEGVIKALNKEKGKEALVKLKVLIVGVKLQQKLGMVTAQQAATIIDSAVEITRVILVDYSKIKDKNITKLLNEVKESIKDKKKQTEQYVDGMIQSLDKILDKIASLTN